MRLSERRTSALIISMCLPSQSVLHSLSFSVAFLKIDESLSAIRHGGFGDSFGQIGIPTIVYCV